MRFRSLLLGAFAVFIAQAAQAADYIDTIDVPGAFSGYDDSTDNVTQMASSFTASGVPTISTITLALSVVTPTDNGSVLVYLVADDGAGGRLGMAGDPTYAPTGGKTVSFINNALLGTIEDSALTTSHSLVSLAVTAAEVATVAAQTKNDEYWIALQPQGGSSAGWWFNSGAPAGFGTANQAFWNDYAGTIGPSAPVSAGAYDLVVDAPVTEPGGLAILGVSLAAFGIIRRKSAGRN